jgi:hypothetical protein
LSFGFGAGKGELAVAGLAIGLARGRKWATRRWATAKSGLAPGGIGPKSLQGFKSFSFYKIFSIFQTVLNSTQI